MRWSAGVAAAVVLAGGGAAAGAALAGHGSGPSGRSAALSAAVSPAASPAPGAARAKARAHRRRALARLRAHGIHGEATFRTKNGFRELAFERGTIQSVSSQDVVVRSPDGTTWTWTLASKTVVRDHGKKGSVSDLAGGDRVVVAGPQTGTTRTARVIIIPKKSPGSSTSGTGSSPSASGT